MLQSSLHMVCSLLDSISWVIVLCSELIILETGENIIVGDNNEEQEIKLDEEPKECYYAVKI